MEVYAYSWSDAYGDGRVSSMSLYVSFVLMSFMSLVFYYGLWNVGIMLYSLLEKWGMFGMRRKEVYVSWVILYVFWVKLCQEDERTSEDYVWVLLEKGKTRGPWGLIGGEYGVYWTFLLESQPLVWFYFIAFEVWGFKSSFTYDDRFGKLSLNAGRLCPIFSKNVQKIAAPCWL